MRDLIIFHFSKSVLHTHVQTMTITYFLFLSFGQNISLAEVLNTQNSNAYIADDLKSISLTVEFDRVKTTDLDSTNLASHLEIILPDVDNSAPLSRSESATTIEGRLMDFYWEEQIPTQVEESASKDNESIVTYQIIIKENSFSPDDADTIQGLLEGNNSIKITVGFRKKGENAETNYFDNNQIFATQIYSGPNAAPTELSVTGIHKGIHVNWKGNEKIEYTDSKSFTPSRVLIMAFPADATDITLSAKVISPTDGNHKEATCTYSSAGDSCITCAPSNSDNSDDPEDNSSDDTATDHIFITNEPTHVEGVKFQLASNLSPDSSSTINSLDKGTEYRIVVQYEKGAVRSSCLSATPIETKSLAELVGDQDAVEGDPRCFIVSAAFGSPLKKQVHLFRWFRDTFIMPLPFGPALMDVYYENSQTFADEISHSQNLSFFVRLLLWPIAGLLICIKIFWGFDIGLKVLILFSILLSACFFTRKYYFNRA